MDWVNITGFALTIIGFIITLWQLARTKRAAEAARLAAEQAQRRMSNNHLLVLLPQLQKVEQDLDAAAMKNDEQSAMDHLAAWKWQAGQLRGWLGGAPSLEGNILHDLQASVTLASEAKNSLLSGTTPVIKVTKRVRAAISAVTDQTGALAAQLSTHTGGSNDNG